MANRRRIPFARFPRLGFRRRNSGRLHWVSNLVDAPLSGFDVVLLASFQDWSLGSTAQLTAQASLQRIVGSFSIWTVPDLGTGTAPGGTSGPYGFFFFIMLDEDEVSTLITGGNGDPSQVTEVQSENVLHWNCYACGAEQFTTNGVAPNRQPFRYDFDIRVKRKLRADQSLYFVQRSLDALQNGQMVMAVRSLVRV